MVRATNTCTVGGQPTRTDEAAAADMECAYCISDVIVVAKAGCSVCCTSDYWVKTSTPPTQECGPWPGEGGATAAFAATAAAEAPVATEGEVLTGEHF